MVSSPGGATQTQLASAWRHTFVPRLRRWSWCSVVSGSPWVSGSCNHPAAQGWLAPVIDTYVLQSPRIQFSHAFSRTWCSSLSHCNSAPDMPVLDGGTSGEAILISFDRRGTERGIDASRRILRPRCAV